MRSVTGLVDRARTWKTSEGILLPRRGCMEVKGRGKSKPEILLFIFLFNPSGE